MKGFIAAINHGLKDSMKDPDAAIDAVAKREPLIKPAVERERFDATLKDEMNRPEIAKIGLGNVDKARLKKSIDILVDAQKLPRTPDGRRNLHRAFCRRSANCRRSCSDRSCECCRSSIRRSGSARKRSCNGAGQWI